MRIRAYASAHDVAFGAAQAAVVQVLGAPKYTSRASTNQIELVYENARVFLSEGRVVSVSVDSDIVEIDGLSTPYELLNDFLRQEDAKTFDAVGFIVSPRYGVAFDPDFPKWVNAFADCELPHGMKHAV